MTEPQHTQHPTLAHALAAFQAEVPKMSKDEKAKVKGETKDGRSYDRSYDYAGLDQFVEIVEPILGRHGLSVTSAPDFDDKGRYVLTVTLLHESGVGERTGVWPLPDPYRSGPQDIGSAMTYGRRYVGWGLTGTFPGGIDDDGEQAQQHARDSWENAQPRQARPVSAPPAQGEPKTSWTDEEVDGYQAGFKTASLVQAGSAYDWMAAKNLHERAVGPSQRTATLMYALRLHDIAAAPDATVEEIDAVKSEAQARGVLKVKVSPEHPNLEQALYEAKEVALFAADQRAQAETDLADGVSPGSAGSAGSENDD